MKKLPKARNADIVVQNLKNEVLIYDYRTHTGYNLNETSALVYHACNGQTSFEDIKTKYKFTDDLIFLALEDLRKADLLEADQMPPASPFAGMSRRETIKKVALGTALALPLISSLVAPTAAQSQSLTTCPTDTCGCEFPAGDNSEFCTNPILASTCGPADCGCRINPSNCFGPAGGTRTCFGNCGSILV